MAGIVVRQRNGATRTVRFAALRSRLNGGQCHHFLSFGCRTHGWLNRPVLS